MTTIDAEGALRIPRAAARARADIDGPGGFFLFLFLVGLHTRLTLPSTEIPFLFCAVISVVFFLLVLDTISWRDLRWPAIFFAVGLISVVLAPNAVSELTPRARELLYFGYSLFCATSVFLLVKRLHADTVAAVMLSLVMILLVGQVLELAVPSVRHASDAFSEVMNPNTFYDSFLRDLEMNGGLRPKFFTNEPSWLAFSMALYITVWTRFSRMPGKYFISGLLLVASAVIGRSPTIVVGVVGVGSLYFCEMLHEARRTGRLDRLVWQLLIAAIALAILIGVLVYTQMNRIEEFVAGQDTSTTIRFFVPPVLAYLVLQQHPWFGVGIGGKHTIAGIMFAAIKSFGINAQFLIDADKIDQVIASSFFEMIISFGAIGAIVFVFFVSRMQMAESRRWGFFFYPTVFAYWSLMGAFMGTWIWVATFLLLVEPRQDFPRRPRRVSSPAKALQPAAAPGA